jgi:hypothetical protein
VREGFLIRSTGSSTDCANESVTGARPPSVAGKHCAARSCGATIIKLVIEQPTRIARV